MVGRKLLGRYEILGEIGRGGMGVVYKALDTQAKTTVAVKVLSQYLMRDATSVKRFKREAINAARLNHPNIVTILDWGEERDVPYFVMEYLPGRTLKRIIAQESPLALARTERILDQLASALDHAHKQGVVHRDVKPSNIFVSRRGRVTLTDFGIAKAVSGVDLTSTGTIVGSPHYMSPEQCQGRRLDKRTDIYSLGVVLYEMLVGRVPFSGQETPAILHAHVYERPPDIHRLRRGLPGGTGRVVRKTLAKDPKQRYSSASELARAFAAAAKSELPEPPTAEARAARRRGLGAPSPRVVQRGKSLTLAPAQMVGVATIGVAVVLLVLLATNALVRPGLKKAAPIVPAAPTRTLQPTFTSTPTQATLPEVTAVLTQPAVSTTEPAPAPIRPAELGGFDVCANPKVGNLATTFEIVVSGWDVDKDNRVRMTLVRPDGSQTQEFDLPAHLELWSCGGTLRPGFKLRVTPAPEEDELPGLWSVSVEALPSGETATVAFIVQPP